MTVRRHALFLAGIGVTPIALLIGFISGGAGHGNYVGARIVLPLACLAIGDYRGAGLIVVVAALLQWPLYGSIVDCFRSKAVAVIVLLTIHAALCVWLFVGKFSAFL